MVEIEKISDSCRFFEMRDEWNDLLMDSASNCLFLTWEWLYTWWKYFSDGRKLHVITVRHAGKLIAIAPCVLRSRLWKRLLPFRAIEFLGVGIAGSDYLDLLIRTGYERQALPALGGALAGYRQILEFSQIKQDASLADDLAAHIAQQGWSKSYIKTDVCPSAKLTDHDWESYLASLGSKHRYNVRRRLKNIEKMDYTFMACRTEEDREEALRVLIELHNRRWRLRGGTGVFSYASMICFHEEFSRIALAEGWLRLYVLRIDGKPVAALYGFHYNDVFYFYQSGFDPDYYRYSVGLVTMGLAIKFAIGDGARIYDFLRGNESYKYLWSNQQCNLVRLSLFPPGDRGVLYRRIMDVRRSVLKIALLLSPGGVN